MSSPSGQDTVLSAQTSLTLLYSGTIDPTVTAVRAVPGTIYMGTGGSVAGMFWIKQDDGLTTNWSLILNTSNVVQAIQTTTTFYVDSNRMDSYTETGSIAAPFKTIQAAINQISANGDCTLLHGYSLQIANGQYPENVLINSGNIVNLSITGNGCIINPVAGSAFTYVSTNPAITNSLQIFCCENVSFFSDVDFSATTNGDNTGDYSICFFNCVVYTNVNMASILSFNFECSFIFGNLNVTNVTDGYSGMGSEIAGDVVVLDDPSLPYSSSGPGTLLVMESGNNPGNYTVNNNCVLSLRCGAKIGTYGGGEIFTVMNGGLVYCLDSQIYSTITVQAGGTFNAASGWWNPATLTVEAGATFTNRNYSALEAYTASVPGNWAGTPPTNVQAALDRIAAKTPGA